ncbi:23781_t:CDS:1 [Cetraspora pellucida]|uniref:23781_t:CDS:1 n=1 Tax=Cetraspora pellucida TaxID=1433469 RepID=A0A9N8ZXG2_9GLOM|nr:23781_t:CDS:1 [Cetraspora pellucida]
MTSKKYTSKKSSGKKRTPSGFILYKNTNRLNPHDASKRYKLETEDVRIAFERQAEMIRLRSESNYFSLDEKFYKNVYAQMSSITQMKNVSYTKHNLKDPHKMMLLTEIPQLESTLNFVNMDANFYKNSDAAMQLIAQERTVPLSNNSFKDSTSTVSIAENKNAFCVGSNSIGIASNVYYMEMLDK